MADLLRTQFPYALPDARVPPGVSIELTNFCNLRCPYCTSPLRLRSQGLMDEATFDALEEHIRGARIRRVYVVGNGEPTLHPSFGPYMRRLASATRFLSVTTNWQRVTEETISTLFEAPVNLVNVSVDGGDAESYERSRLGGDFRVLLRNLQSLCEEKRRRLSKMLINVRLMLRPSDVQREQKLIEFWRPYGDEVSRQYIVDWAGVDEDVYGHACRVDRYPRCALPFKRLNVNWNGNVPLCTYSHTQSGLPEGVVIGNVRDASLKTIWRNPLIRQYRRGHRRRLPELMPICSGCPGG